MASKYTVELVKGKVRWFYRVTSNNGNYITTSQKYWSKGNAKRAALRAAQLMDLKYKEIK